MSEPTNPLVPDVVLQGLLQLVQAHGGMVSVKEAASGRYLWANEPMLQVLGVPVDRLVGHTDLEVLPLADASSVRAADQRALGGGGVVTGEQRFERQGQRQDYRTWRCVLPAAGGTGPGHLLSLWWNDTPARQSAQQLQQALAQIERQHGAMEQMRRQQAEGMDRPSELFRREHFEEHLRREVALSLREQREFALVLMAVDRFEELRSRQGDAGVKRVAESIAQLMRSNTRAMDVLAQLGEDRFAILLSGVGLATAYNRMEQLRRACTSQLVVVEGRSFNFEMSVGLAGFPHTAETLDDLSQAAIRALQDARKRGGSRVTLAPIRLGDGSLAGQAA
jgi:diguanylate cyclase (GGDEF)-like protein